MRAFPAIAAATVLLATPLAHAQGASGLALFERGDFPAAAAAYAAALAANPSDRDAELGLASVRLFQNDLIVAKPLLDSVLATDPQNVRAGRLLTELERRQAEAGRRTTIEGAESVVPFVTAVPLPVVRANVNGITANFLVDTGGDVDLEPALAARAGVVTIDSGMGNFAGGLKAPTRSGKLKLMTLGSATAYDVPVHVFPTHASALFNGTKIDGVIGTTFFERFLTTMDYPHNRLLLRPRSASAAFEASASDAHDAIVPCYLVGDHFIMAPAAVNDAAGLFLFDSGLAGGGVMPSNALLDAAKIPVDRARATTGFGGGGAVTAIPFVAQQVSVGAAVQRDVPGIYTPQGSPFSLFPFVVWGAISHEFLKHYAFTMDFDAMKLVLQAPEAARAPTAQQIFDAAFRRLQSYPAPPYAVWTSTWHITRTPMGYYTGEASSVEVNRYALRLADGMENVSDPIPSGKLPPAIIEPEFLGPFAWTIRSSIHVAPEQRGGAMMAPDMAGLMTIAHVVSVAKWPYSLTGNATAQAETTVPPIEQVDGHQTYHFQLHPREDPQKHNLRDLWIDVNTYDIWKVRFVGTYRPVPQAPISPTEATVDFRNVLGCWVVTRSRWTYESSPIIYTYDVQNDEIGLPDTLPDWLFDTAEYRKRQAAGQPDYLRLLLERLRKGNG